MIEAGEETRDGKADETARDLVSCVQVKVREGVSGAPLKCAIR